MYEYGMRVVRVVDGDTVVGLIDLGLHVYVSRNIRLLFYNAPELTMAHAKTKEEAALGVEAKELLKKLLPEGTLVTINTQLDKDDKYGRVLGELWIGGEFGERTNINLEMKSKTDVMWQTLAEAHPDVYKNPVVIGSKI